MPVPELLRKMMTIIRNGLILRRHGAAFLHEISHTHHWTLCPCFPPPPLRDAKDFGLAFDIHFLHRLTKADVQIAVVCSGKKEECFRSTLLITDKGNDDIVDHTSRKGGSTRGQDQTQCVEEWIPAATAIERIGTDAELDDAPMRNVGDVVVDGDFAFGHQSFVGNDVRQFASKRKNASEQHRHVSAQQTEAGAHEARRSQNRCGEAHGWTRKECEDGLFAGQRATEYSIYMSPDACQSDVRSLRHACQLASGRRKNYGSAQKSSAERQGRC